ncbi:hypothetical protein FH972_026529 [Carpinus fangiana]|uniref:Uncharacterized protein n=1 Tax=Carpinus fangiana TaxID=176857 RepID=A0A5N6L4K2_9ROSI|nr:hypothetical protein FH972_026529 [Carpinus fangiana]
MPPILTATTSSARQLLALLRCISFANKAHVRITDEGIRFSVEEARVLQGIVSLDKHLFTTYHYHPPEDSQTSSATATEHSSQPLACPPFQISLHALLETLQIFGMTDPAMSQRSSNRGPSADPFNTSGVSNAHYSGAPFDSRTLGMSGLVRITYPSVGSPLCVTLEEGSVTTSCELVAFEPDRPALLGADDTEDVDDDFDIPFDRMRIIQKIILPGSALAEALSELASVGPDVLILSTSATKAPHFSLSAVGNNASAQVDFSKDSPVLETFSVRAPQAGEERRLTNRYKFSMVNAAARAMAISAKASVRGDAQGVLSLQFMVETGVVMGMAPEGGGGSGSEGVSFVDFRFVPLVEEDNAGDGDATDSE